MKRTKTLCAVTTVLMAVLLVALSVSIPIGALDTVTTSNQNKIDSVLREKINSMSDSDKVPVSVWFEDIDYKEVKNQVEERLKSDTRAFTVSQKAIDLAFYDVENTLTDIELSTDVLCDTYSEITTEEVKAVIEEERAVASKMYQEHNQSMVNELLDSALETLKIDSTEEFAIDYVCRYAPNADLALTKSQILSAVANNKVTEINYIDASTDPSVEHNGIEEDEELDDPYDMTYFNVTGLATARDAWGLDGTGMNVGMIEDQGRPHSISTLGHVEYVYGNSNPTVHATLVAETMVETSYREDGVLLFMGAIPKANLYTASTVGSQSVKEAAEALLDCGVIAINCSFSYPKDNPLFNNIYGDIAKWYDHISVQHNVHLILTSSNEGANGVPYTNTSYNAIVVGSCYNDGLILSDSSYIIANDFMNKPDLVAPGYRVRATNGTGTSFAAPMVTSAVVQLSQASPILLANPTLMKAILLSGSTITNAMNVDTDVFSDANGTESAISHIYGAGMLNVTKAYTAFTDGYYETETMSPYSRSVQFRKNISRAKGKTVRVCLTWNKMNSVATPHETGVVSSGILDNFMLTVTTPSGVVYSAQNLYDNKQMISFIASESGSYTFNVSRFGTGVSDEIVRFSLAYSVQS
ncbi:MAG: S8 family serine peptidase [Ruminococcus sp.]|nr:S8 family serine peptidase [Ruminococcus sp.]